MRVIVAGSRDIEDGTHIEVAVERSGFAPSVVIHGGAKGADTLAGAFAEARGLAVEVYPADWQKHGRAAGPRRNARMIAQGDPDALIAVWNGGDSRGTKDMVRQAREAGLPIFLYRTTDGRVWRENGLSRFDRMRRRDLGQDRTPTLF